MMTIGLRIDVDVDDLERLVRLAHQINEHEPIIGVHHPETAPADAKVRDLIVDGVVCNCGEVFISDDRRPASAAGQHAGHVERAVREAQQGRL